MAISDPVSVTVIITLVFSALSFLPASKGKSLKMLAGICWFVTAFIYFITNMATGAVTFAVSTLFAGFGIIFCVFAYQDFFGEKRKQTWEFED